MRSRRSVLAHVLTLVLVAGLGGVASGSTDQGDEVPGGQAPVGEVVTLVTGDRVTVAGDADGLGSLAIEPAPRDGYEPTFDAVTDGDDTYVLPSDASRLVPEVLDRELFNVTRLVDYGYTDGVPVIVGGGLAGSVPLVAPSGVEITAQLPSIDAVAATIDDSGQWWGTVAVSPEGSRSSGRGEGAGSLAGVDKVWLDGRIEASLDESVPQIGAPAAWDAGYDGTGVTVAVLDTGIDTAHPDLAGKVAAEANFTNADTTSDLYGHGTHVAGIVTGSGAASDGTHVGVAPGVELLNGKVLNDFGFGQESEVIAGMEWATTQGADIVNMSLGGCCSDGGDPMSQAVNQLSAEHDVLFVIAAGNSGSLGPGSIESPGAADAALTVGSVSKQEQLAASSGRGPRLGDFAVKPEITGPGVDIVSARSSEGTLPPPAEPVDEFYLRASGTSMATPHVAGAAALLLHQRPDLGAADLKAALVSTATPNEDLDVYEQGGGRVDVPRVIETAVHAAPATVDIGVFEFPHDDTDPVGNVVAYTNITDEAVTLDLSFDVASQDGDVPGEAMLSVDPAVVTLAPGEAAEVTVTVDVTHGEIGLYAGYLVASDGSDVATRTPLNFYKQEELHELTLVGIARDGDPAEWSSSLDIVNIDGSHDLAEYLIPFDGNGEISLRLPPGVYSTSARIDTYLSSDLQVHETTVVAVPEIVLDEDTTVVLDARDGVELTVETPAHDDSAVHRLTIGYLRRGAANEISWLALREEWNRFFAVPTEPAKIGEFEFFTHWRLGEPKVALDAVEMPFELAFPPVLFPDSPVLDAVIERPLVDAGVGAPEDYDGIDAEDAIVLVRRGGPSFFAKGANAADAGAAGLLVANDRPGQVPAFGIGPDATMPAVRLSQADGNTLLGLLGQGDVTLRLSGQRNTDYLYELVYPEPASIPSELTYVADVEELATIENAFHSDVDAVETAEFRELFRPWQASSVVFQNELVAPQHRTEYLTPGDTRHRQRVLPPGGSMQEYLTSYEPGELREQSWWKQVTRPGVRRGSPQESARPARRDGDTLVLELAEWVDADGNWGDRSFVDTTAFRYFRDGELVIATNRPRGQFAMSPEPAEYRLELDVARDADWWTTSTATHTAWTLQSARPPAGEEIVPLLLVDYKADLDLLNTAPNPRDRRGRPTVELQVGHQPGADGPAIAGARAWISYDDGDTWQARPTRSLGDGRYDVILDSRDPDETNGFVAMRVEAWDAEDNRIEQEITRAWKLAPR